MSCYCKMKVLRIPYEPQEWGWRNFDPQEDSCEYVEKHFSEDVFDPYGRKLHTFRFAPTESERRFVDYLLEYDGDSDSEYGKVRELYDSEIKRYLDTFRQLGPIDMNKVRLVEFCWYNATEAPDYYDIKSDPFYDPV